MTGKVIRFFFKSFPSALDPTSASKFWEKKAENVMNSNSCKNRKDIAGQCVSW